MKSLSRLSNTDLLAGAKRLAGAERRCAAELVLHIAEIERRHLHLTLGFPSLYAYCTEVLRLSDFEALARIEAARAGRRFPRVFEMLLDGSLSLTTAQLVSRHLTHDNHAVLLADAAGKTKKEVQHVLARWFPQPDVPASVRKLPVLQSGLAPTVTAEPASPIAAPPPPLPSQPLETAVSTPALPPPVASAPAARAVVAPLAPDRYRVTFTSDEETATLLDLARDMLSHAVPTGDIAEVMKRALKALVSDLARKKFGATERPRKSKGPKDESDIPAAVKQEVWVRDGGRCAFVGTTGRRCGSRWQIEFHHLDERCNRGKGTARNIQLRCAAHNRYEAAFEDAVPKRARDEAMFGGAGEEVTRSGPSAARMPPVFTVAAASGAPSAMPPASGP